MKIHLLLHIISVIVFSSNLFAGESEELVIDATDFDLSPEIGTFQKLKYNNIVYYKLVDMNNDGDKDIVFFWSGQFRYISIRTRQELSIGEIPLSDPPAAGLFFCTNINHDAVPEIIYLTVNGTDAYLNIYYTESQEKKRIKIYHGENYFQDNIYDIVLVDAKLFSHSSGEELLLLELNTGHDRAPRGIMALSVKDCSIRWQFFSGANAFGPMYLYDVVGDTRLEILFSTFAADNGVTLNGFSDNKSYFIILDENGNEQYHYPYSGPLSYCYFNLILPSKDIVLYGYTNDQNSLQPEIVKLSGEDFVESKSFTSDYKRSHLSPNNTACLQKGYSLGFLGNHNNLYLLNEYLSETKQIIFPMPIDKVQKINSHELGANFYLCASRNAEDESSMFYLMKDNFHVTGKKKIPIVNISSINYSETEQGLEFYFFSNRTGELYNWYIPEQQLMQKFRIKYFIKAHSMLITYIAIALLFVASALLVINLIGRKNLNIQKYKALSDYLINNPSEAILIVDGDGNLTAYNHTFSRWFDLHDTNFYIQMPVEILLQKLKINWLIKDMKSAIVIGNKPFQKNNEIEIEIAGRLHRMTVDIQKISTPGDQFYLIVKFFDLTESLNKDRITSWAAIAQKMAHEIKNPLMSMTLSLNRLEKMTTDSEEDLPEKDQKYIGYIREDIKRMKESTNEFLRFTSSLKLNPEYIDINKLIVKLVNEYYQLYAERIHFEQELAQSLPDVYIDEEQTAQILRYIIDNGIDAMAGTGILQIRTELMEKIDEFSGTIERCVLVFIGDNGPGIAPEDLARIFEPNFTTKKTGSGFGLAIAKQIIELQDGQIKISSKPDVGTVVEIEFHAKEET